MYPNMYQVMYVEKNSTYFGVFGNFGIDVFFLRGRILLDEIVGSQKWTAPSNIGPPNNQGVKIRTTPNKSAFLLGTQIVSWKKTKSCKVQKLMEIVAS